MDDALMSMFWAGVGIGVCGALAIFGVIAVVWWLWPQPHEDIGPDDEFRVVADDPGPTPLPGWDAAAAVDGWHALENRRRNTDA